MLCDFWPTLVSKQGILIRDERGLEDLQSEHWDRALGVMTTSGFYAIKHGSKAMMVISVDKPKPGGSFVITSSCASILGSYADLAYSELLGLQIPLLRSLKV